MIHRALLNFLNESSAYYSRAGGCVRVSRDLVLMAFIKLRSYLPLFLQVGQASVKSTGRYEIRNETKPPAMRYNENKPIHYSLNLVEDAEINCENTSWFFFIFLSQRYVYVLYTS